MTSLGTLVLSFDTELGWGSIESGLWYHRQESEVYKKTRKAIRILLKEMERLELPATWAVVGGLLEEPRTHCLDHLPVTTRDATVKALRDGNEETFHGLDLIEAIHLSKINHELACHTYSHTRFNSKNVDEAFICRDLKYFRHIFPKEMGQPISLVYPCNEEGFFNQVQKCGFHIIRGALSAQGSKAYRLLMVVAQPPPLANTYEIIPGLKRISGSLFFNPGFTRSYLLPLIYRRALWGLKAAIHENGIFCIWNHPFNFGESPSLLASYISFLRQAAVYRDAGQLQVQTMKDVMS